MEVLNTYGGGEVTAIGWAVALFVWAIFFGILAFCCLEDRRYGYGAVCFIMTLLLLTASSNELKTEAIPVRHEVILREGYVIDAAKYNIIEQRGAIYVIEEREPADK